MIRRLGAKIAIPAARNALPVLPRLFAGIAASTLILLLLALCAALLNNNVSIGQTSREEFVGNLDRVIAHSTGWTFAQYRQTVSGGVPTSEGYALLSNSATAYMVVDCASLSTESPIKALGSSFLDAWKVRKNFLGKIVDPAMPVNAPSDGELRNLEEYQRWILHGVAPNDFPLSSSEMADMFSPDKYRTGKATHQLFALYFYRKSQGSTPELNHLMRKIEERIAWEAALDFRVTDLYLQRLAFLLAAGRSDLIRPRWIERAFAAQQIDGGWRKSWHGWDRTPYRFSFSSELTSAHPTAQGMWIAYMLKYRYPEWIDRNYK